MAASAESLVEEFMKLTGASSDVSRGLLEACSWNLELAVGMHLDGVTSLGSSSHPHINSSSYEEIHGVRAPIPQTRGVLIEQEPLPRRTLRRRNLPTSVFDPFQDYSGNVETASHSNHTKGSSSSKQKTLAELFKPPTDIMFQGTFQEARLAGQMQNKWLLVNIQDSREFRCQVLNRDVWNNHQVKKIISNQFIFLQIQHITDDGIRFRQLYEVEGCPIIMVIDPRTGEQVTKWNDLSQRDFINKVQEFLLENSLRVTSSKKTSSIYDRTENEQLEAAIKASLTSSDINGSDTELDNCVVISSGSETNDDFPDDEIKRQTNKRPNEEDASRSSKIPKLETLNEDHYDIENHKDNAAHILIRFPDGRRCSRHFNANYSIQELFHYLNQEGIDLAKYEVITTHPKTVVSSLSKTITFKEAGLFPSQTVYVQFAD